MGTARIEVHDPVRTDRGLAGATHRESRRWPSRCAARGNRSTGPSPPWWPTISTTHDSTGCVSASPRSPTGPGTAIGRRGRSRHQPGGVGCRGPHQRRTRRVLRRARRRTLCSDRSSLDGHVVDLSTVTEERLPLAHICLDPFHIMQWVNRTLDTVYSSHPRSSVDGSTSGLEWRRTRTALRTGAERPHQRPTRPRRPAPPAPLPTLAGRSSWSMSSDGRVAGPAR